MASFPKPENALKRAEELINVGQKLDALQSLRDLITSKRHRAWQKPLEKIMFKYVELCVELQKGRFAKDGLIQYRIVCQQVNVTSLEEVIKHFLHLATERAELARNQAQALEEALDVDDLEADRRPEDLMISYVSGEKGKERSDRELVTPWFKFLWETYRTVLEILRNNSKLETLYSMTAHRAFQFCKQYKRTTEFRRLCEIIRNHLTNLNKYRDQRDRPDLSSPETLQLYLDTRFEQLKIATELEMWQEAFRSIEDIHGLMCLVKKTPKPSMMVTYYAKLTEIFWISSSHLYHAYAWLRLFSVLKSYNKNLSQKDLQLSASSVVLAALSVPPYDMTYGASHMVLENKKEHNLRIASLIGFNLDGKPENRELLSRASLLSELGSRGVMTCVNPEVKDLFNLLEHDFVPLDLPSKVLPLLTKISKISGKLSSASSVPEVHLSHYLPALERLAILRLLHQVSQVYSTLKVDNLRRMVEDFGSCDVKKIIVEAVKHNFVEMKVNHVKGVIMFVHKGLESGNLTSHLSVFSELLNNARSIIYAPLQSQSKLSALLPTLPEVVEKEHRRLLARKLIIEKRKEEQERTLLEMEREEESRRLKLQKITQEAEQKRLASEYEQRKNQRIRREIEERELEEARALLQEAEKRSKKKGKKALIEGEKVTKQSLMELAISEQLRERQETEKKLQKLAKTMDHLERAKREEAAPLIEAAFHHRMVEEKVLHDHEEQEAVKSSQARHDGDVKEKNRLSRMLENKVIFEERVISHRRDDYERLKKERDERIAEIVRKRKQERDEKRKLLYFLRTEEERQKRAREEEEVRKQEEAERKKREEAEHKAKMDEVAEKQRRVMREVEEKERLRKEELLRGMNNTRTPSRDSDSVASERPAESVPAAAAAVAPSPGKYVPKFKRAEAPPEPDRWGGGRQERPSSDKWRSDDRRAPSFGGGSSRSSWSSRYSARG